MIPLRFDTYGERRLFHELSFLHDFTIHGLGWMLRTIDSFLCTEKQQNQKDL
jgi:hypothetical protein